MILEYHRPDNLEQALHLLERDTPRTLPLAGGTVLTNLRREDFAVVDLQALGLDYIHQDGNSFVIGAMSRMHSLASDHNLYPSLRELIVMEFSSNLRQMATLGGELVACHGRSALATAFLAMDARMVWLPGEIETTLGNFLPLRSSYARGQLLKDVKIPAHGELLTEKVARSPADQPILSVAVFRWPSGRTRVALGGHGAAPILALDGPDGSGVEPAVRIAYQQANDPWASGEYRCEVAAQMAGRMIRALERS